MALAAMMMISCSKNKQINSAQSGNPVVKDQGNPCQGWPPEHLVTDLRFRGDIFCTLPCMNCFYEVVIVGKKENIVNRLYTSFQSHYEDNTIPDFFSNENYSQLFPYLSSDTVNLIVRGKFNVIRRQSTMDSTIAMYIFLHKWADTNQINDSTVFTVLQVKN